MAVATVLVIVTVTTAEVAMATGAVVSTAAPIGLVVFGNYRRNNDHCTGGHSHSNSSNSIKLVEE